MSLRGRKKNQGVPPLNLPLSSTADSQEDVSWEKRPFLSSSVAKKPRPSLALAPLWLSSVPPSPPAQSVEGTLELRRKCGFWDLGSVGRKLYLLFSPTSSTRSGKLGCWSG